MELNKINDYFYVHDNDTRLFSHPVKDIKQTSNKFVISSVVTGTCLFTGLFVPNQLITIVSDIGILLGSVVTTLLGMDVVEKKSVSFFIKDDVVRQLNQFVEFDNELLIPMYELIDFEQSTKYQLVFNHFNNMKPTSVIKNELITVPRKDDEIKHNADVMLGQRLYVYKSRKELTTLIVNQLKRYGKWEPTFENENDEAYYIEKRRMNERFNNNFDDAD